MEALELTPAEQEKVDSILPMLKVRMMARQITCNDHLEAILRDAEPGMRRGVYDLIKPHLTFKPKSFLCMKFKKLQRVKAKAIAANSPVIVYQADGIKVVKRAQDAK